MDKVIGNCSKHPGQNFVNCPLCEIERQKKLSKNFWDNVQKDVDRVNPTPEGVTADLLEKLKDDTHDAIWDSIYAEGGEVGGGNKAVEKCVEIAIEYASLVSSSDKKEIARLTQKVEFYRQTTDKVRELIFSRNDIGQPCQPLYDSIYDKITLQDSEIARLKEDVKELVEELDNIINLDIPIYSTGRAKKLVQKHKL